MSEELREIRMFVLNILKEGRLQVEEADKIINYINKLHEEKTKLEEGNPAETVSSMAKEGVSKLEKLVNDIGFNIEKAVHNIGTKLNAKTETEQKATPVADKFTFTDKQTITPENIINKLIINNSWGGIKITGEDRTDISLDIEKIIWTKNSELAEDRNKGLIITSEQKESIMEISLPPLNPVLKDNVNLELKVPKNTELNLTSVSGDIFVYKMDTPDKDIFIKTESGEIELHPAKFAMAELASVSGDIYLKETESKVNVRTTSGAIEFDGILNSDSRISSISGDIRGDSSVNESVEITSSSGNIEFKAARNKDTKLIDLVTNSSNISYKGIVYDVLRARSNSGNITGKSGIADVASVEVSTTSGDISWAVDEYCSISFNCESKSGDIFSNVPMDDNMEKTSSSLKGKLKDGAGKLNITSGSGDIRFHRE